MTDSTATRPRVLIVDDEPGMRTTLGDILEEEGYRVDLADCGEQALQLCSEAQYDILLMDYRMPGLDGLETYRRIRDRQTSARVILMSAYSAQGASRQALEEGVDAFLRKPLDLEQVLKLVAGERGCSMLVAGSQETADELRRALRELGYRPTVASDATEALRLVEQISYELVFLDASLPSMDGLELYLAIRKRAPSVVAVVLAGSAAEAEVARLAIERTAYTSLGKPVQLEELEKLLTRLNGQLASKTLWKPSQEKASS